MNWRLVRAAWRLFWMSVCLLAGLAAALTVMRTLSPNLRRALIQTWARWTLRAAGIRVKSTGKPWISAGLVLPNHVSWLDILVIDSVAPCSFIAKAEIRSWPLVGLLCDRAGTLFIERGRRHAVHQVLETATEQLRAGGRVAVFAEGTTSDGTVVLPFHANLVEAAVRANCAVQPLALRYEDGSGQRSTAVDFVGATTFAQSLWRVLAEPITRVVMVPLAPLTPHAAPDPAQSAGVRNRHGLARAAEVAVRQTLFPLVTGAEAEVVFGVGVGAAAESAFARAVDLEDVTISQPHRGELTAPDTARIERDQVGAVDQAKG
ncbi:MAG: 1-acyl-sn-glycerol-3-phosphate acyltransferase [Betaproteobacteria bacterium]|nr:1-acyl-sn-glycerol-3-phosphate acyltransferase [Betaproteobacteria bacterium]